MVNILEMERAPTHPGEMLNEEFLKPRGISQSEFARYLGVSFPRLNDLIHARRGVTIETALLLAAALNTSPELWLNLQHGWDLWQAVHGDRDTAFTFPDPLWIKFEGKDGEVYEMAPNPNQGVDLWLIRNSDGDVVVELPVAEGDWPPKPDDIRRAIAAVEGLPRKRPRRKAVG
jgi:addiction module HigA family antidote